MTGKTHIPHPTSSQGRDDSEVGMREKGVGKSRDIPLSNDLPLIFPLRDHRPAQEFQWGLVVLDCWNALYQDHWNLFQLPSLLLEDDR